MIPEFKRYDVGKWLRYAAVASIAGLLLWNANSLVTGEIGTMFVPRHIHESYYRYKDFILGQPEYFRVLGVPVHSKWMVYTGAHPRVDLVSMTRGGWGDFSLPSIDGHPRKDVLKYASPLTRPFSDRLLDVSAIRYVVVPRDDPENADDFFGAYGMRDDYLALLDGLPYLRRIDAGTDRVIVYENEGARPHLYTTAEAETIGSEVAFRPVESEMVTPSEYRVTLRSVSAPVYLNFSEAYHPDWNVRVGGFSWWDSLRSGEYFLPGSIHSESDAGLNSFRIDPGEMCGRSLDLARDDREGDGSRVKPGITENGSTGDEVCTKNPDGSYDIDLTIFFRPQAHLLLGLLISGATLALILAFLGYASVRKRLGRGATEAPNGAVDTVEKYR